MTEKTKITQSRGPTLRFTGELLCETEFPVRSGQPGKMVLELWETAAGNWIAVSSLEPQHGDPDTRAVVIDKTDDVQAMRFAAMDHWDWHNRARSMVRDALKWRLDMEVA